MIVRDRAAAGTVLVMVLFIVAILSVVAVSRMMMTRSEVSAAAAAGRGLEARATAMSGIHCAMAVLMNSRDDQTAWFDNPPVFQAQSLTGQGDAEKGWHFTVYAESREDPTSVRYGLVDEASKLNLNIATEEMLAQLPNMTLERVDCLLDYCDGDDEPRPNGAEQEYYDTLPWPYRIKNGPLGTLEELLLVKGFTGTVVFGEDANCNGLLEPNEDDGDDSFPPDDPNGQLDRGLRCLATAITYEPNVDSDGNQRININSEDPASLARVLEDAGFGQETVDFLVAARRANVSFPDPSHLLEATLEVDDPKVQGRKITISSGVDRSNLHLVMDKLTTGGVRHPATGQEILFGRVNLSSAPEEVLRALPGLDGESAGTIVSVSGGLEGSARSTTAWIYTEGVVSADAFKKVSPYVTARSYQYRVRSFGYNPQLGRFCVLEAVIDLAQGQPRIAYLRDLTHLGVPFVPSGVER